ncbi:MAG: AbgT family transporter [Candidatus Izemoplasmatales bacterium]|nr:AbgT family transporter [Candidatus Izemoplasmatales bacterium]MDY0373253.1 AbgT family transporter [Candidatus Izemoplasmatales bacterium]
MERPELINISKKSFISVVAILLVLMIFAGVMTLLIPQGSYARDAGGGIIPDSFIYAADPVSYPFWRWFIAPVTILFSTDALNVIMISLFLLILGGTFSLMDKTGGIRVMIQKLIDKFQTKKYVLLRLVILVFMMFGAFFGIFEESVALLPIMIMLSLSLGWDTMTGIGMCLLAAGFGFASGITNPFSVGIASEFAGISVLSGVWYRLIVFVIMYLLLSTFLVIYAKRIEKNPSLSPTFKEDEKKTKDFDLLSDQMPKNAGLIFKSYTTMFAVVLLVIILTGVLELTGLLSISAIPIIAIAFLVGGLISGVLITKNLKQTGKMFLGGALSVAPAVLLIFMAASVKHIIESGMIMDTILYYLANLLSGKSPIVGLLLIYALVLLIEFAIGSSSAKAFLVMPLLVPLVPLIGISNELAILAFVFGDGYTNVIFPTNGVLLIGLSIASVSYPKWFKFTILLQLATLAVTVLMLVIGVWIGY